MLRIFAHVWRFLAIDLEQIGTGLAGTFSLEPQENPFSS